MNFLFVLVYFVLATAHLEEMAVKGKTRPILITGVSVWNGTVRMWS